MARHATTGNMETINGITFQSAHTIGVGVAISTGPGEPDYIVVAEAEWDVAGWANQRLKGLNIGMMTGPGLTSLFPMSFSVCSIFQLISRRVKHLGALLPPSASATKWQSKDLPRNVLIRIMRSFGPLAQTTRSSSRRSYCRQMA